MKFYKKTIITTFLLSVLALPAWSKGNITGTVLNKETEDPMDFVTIQIFNAKTNQPLQITGITDDEGIFELENVPDGHYRVKIMNVGSIDQERDAVIKGNDINLGTIRLADDSKVLQEVVVEGIRSTMKFELDKKVFTVDSNIASAGSSASELLESIPSVEVDQDGEVSLRGNSSVTIWLNGKDSGLTADNRAQILEQIPAENIEKIEVITNPSAKYSPEGTAGIINIILKKDRRGGYYGSAEVSGSSRGGANASFNINYNTRKWDTFAGIGFRYRNNTGGSKMYRDFDDGTFVHSNGKSHNYGNNVFLRLGATYHPTDNDDIYVSGFGMFGHNWSKSSTNYSADQPDNWLTALQKSHNKGDMRGAHGELGYTHRFRENHTLDIMGSYNYWGGAHENEYVESENWPNDSTSSTYRRQEMPMNSQSWEAKVDYVNHLNDHVKIEAGFAGNYSKENTPNTTYRGSSEASAELAQNLYNRFIYNNNISALYATVGGKAGIFSYSVGLRGEAWQINTKSLSYGESESQVAPFKKSKFSLFPSVYLSLNLPHDNELQLNYSRRIRRPWGGQLNSFRDISDPTSVSYGNPELQPQYSNSFELNYLKSWTYHILSISAYMRQSSDIMNQVSYRDNDIVYSTWANISSQINSGVEIVGKNRLFKDYLDLTTTVNLYHNHISGWDYKMTGVSGREVSMSGKAQNAFSWDARMMANVKLPWGMSFQATGRYSSGHRTATGSHEPGWTVDAGLRKVAGNWSFSLNCRDIFDSRRFKNTVYGENYSQVTQRWRGGTTFRLTIKYSFGNMKGKRPKGNRQDQMNGMDEDMQMGSGSSGYSEM